MPSQTITRASAPRTGLVDALLLVVAAVWGSTYLAAKDLVTSHTVIAILGLRFLVTAVALAPFCVRRLRRASRAEIGTGLLLGLVLATVMTFETYGIAGTSATNAGLVISLTIVMTPLLENLVARSWLPPAFFAAAVVAVVGVALLASGSSLRAPSLGDLLVLGAAAVRAVHVTVMHRRSAGRQFDSLNLTWLQLSVCAVVFCAASPFAGSSAVAMAGRLDLTQWADLLYLALVCTVFAFFVQMWAVRSTSRRRPPRRRRRDGRRPRHRRHQLGPSRRTCPPRAARRTGAFGTGRRRTRYAVTAFARSAAMWRARPARTVPMT